MSDKTWGGSRPGAGRKRLTLPRTPMTISVTDEIKREIAQLSVGLGLTKGEVVELAIKTIRDLD